MSVSKKPRLEKGTVNPSDEKQATTGVGAETNHSSKPTCKEGNVLVHLVLTGASGYLGQHVLGLWIKKGLLATNMNHDVKVTALFNRAKGFLEAANQFIDSVESKAISDVTVKSMDFTSEEDIQSFVKSSLTLSQETQDKYASIVTVLVHTAALSNPVQCEKKPDLAKAINVPEKFLNAFVDTPATFGPKSRTAIINLSTDQVYDGKQTPPNLYYKETETQALKPVNVYGKTKLDLETLLAQPRLSAKAMCFALRSSVILGPKAPIAPDCAHGNFLDFAKSMGESKKALDYFTNEFRTVVRLDRVLGTIQGVLSHRVLANKATSNPLTIYNMGGPVRVTRMDMAKAVFDKYGYDHEFLLEGTRTEPWSPLDTSMDSSLLFKDGILPPDANNTKEKETFLTELIEYSFGTEPIVSKC